MVSPPGWTGLTAQGVSMGGLLSSAPLGIALTRARSRFGPGNEKHLQEMLSFPPAALEVHRVLQFALVDFGAVCAGQLGKTLLHMKQGEGLMDTHSSFPLPCSLASAWQ